MFFLIIKTHFLPAIRDAAKCFQKTDPPLLFGYDVIGGTLSRGEPEIPGKSHPPAGLYGPDQIHVISLWIAEMQDGEALYGCRHPQGWSVLVHVPIRWTNVLKIRRSAGWVEWAWPTDHRSQRAGASPSPITVLVPALPNRLSAKWMLTLVSFVSIRRPRGMWMLYPYSAVCVGADRMRGSTLLAPSQCNHRRSRIAILHTAGVHGLKLRLVVPHSRALYILSLLLQTVLLNEK